jgi:DNA-binding NarL/FixJ family response regulator
MPTGSTSSTAGAGARPSIDQRVARALTAPDLVGRGDDLEVVVDAYRSRTLDLVLLNGAAGVGKSFLAGRALDRIEALGAPVRATVCTTTMRQIPFGAIAGIAASVTDTLDGAGATLHLTAAAHAALCTTPRTALLVDDVDLIDEPSAGLIAQLLANEPLFVVATVRAGARLPDALRSTAQSERAMWVDLQALDRLGTRTLVESLLGGQIEGSADAAIWNVSQGNPLYVRELVAASVRSGALHEHHGIWVLAGGLSRGQRLHDLVRDRLGQLAEAELELAQLLALCQPVAVDALPPHLLHAAERLEEAGHVRVEVDESVTPRRERLRLSHPIAAEVLAESMSRLGRQRVLREHVHRMGPIGTTGADDVLARTVLELEAGLQPDPAMLQRSVRRAREVPDFRLVKRLALAAIEHETNLEAELLLADALYELGEHDQSRAVHERIGADHHDQLIQMLMATSSHRVYLWGLDAPDLGIAVLHDALAKVHDPELVAAVRAAEMNVLAFSDRPHDALALGESLVGSLPMIESVAAVARCAALVTVGRTGEALDVSRRAEAVQMTLPDPREVIHPSVHVICRAFAHAERGEFDQAVSMATDAFDRFVAIQMPLNEAWSAINAARAHLFRGTLVSARRWANEAAAASDRGNLRSGNRLALMVSAICAAQLGLPTDAHLRQLRELPSDMGFFRVEQPVAEAWCLMGQGRPEEARDVLRAGVAQAQRQRLVSSEVFLVHEAARAGLAAEMAPRAHELFELTDAPFAHARLRHVLALAAGDSDALAACADTFEEMGAVLFGAEAAAAAATRAAADGLQRRASVLLAQSTRLAERCEGARTPGLSVFDTPSPLTDREHEVALLAARGLTSKAIAEQLVVSTRTVDNHLQRIYTKLGVSGRAELAELLHPD